MGHVTVAQLVHVLRALHAQARGPDAPYFAAMVDPLGKGDLTFQELAMAMKSCVEAGTLAWQRGNAQVSAVISKVKAHLMDRHATVLSLFREFDRQGRGFLELNDLLRLFRRAVRCAATASPASRTRHPLPRLPVTRQGPSDQPRRSPIVSRRTFLPRRRRS